MVVYNIIHAFTYIYALCDPETDLVYYVGQATSPKFRHRTHILEAQSPDGISNKCIWTKGLLDRGMEPSLKVLLKVNKEFAIDYEKRMITYYKSTNINFTISDKVIRAATVEGFIWIRGEKVLSKTTG